MTVLVASWLGSTNLGDELLFRALQRKLSARGEAVAGISIDPASTRRAHGVNAVPHLDPLGVLAAANRASAVVFGGGAVIQDETSAFNLPYHLGRVAAARMQRTPVAGVGLGAGPVDTVLGRQLVRRVLGRVPLVVRDRGSLDLLRAIGVRDVQLGADLAYSLASPTPPPTEDVIAVSLRPWTRQRRSRLPVHGQWDAGLEDDATIGALADALDEVVSRTGLQVRMVAFQTDRDHALHRAVAERMATEPELVVPDLDTVLDLVGRSRIVVGMRFHAGVAAVCNRRPAVMLSYSPKVAELEPDTSQTGGGPSTVRVLPYDEDGIGALPEAVESQLSAFDTAAAEHVLDALQTREAANDRALDALLERARTC